MFFSYLSKIINDNWLLNDRFIFENDLLIEVF